LQELFEFPDYFTYSLEGRIKPRFQRTSSRGITCSVEWLLVCNDQRFEEILDANYINIREELPFFSMGETLELPWDTSGSEKEGPKREGLALDMDYITRKLRKPKMETQEEIIQECKSINNRLINFL